MNPRTRCRSLQGNVSFFSILLFSFLCYLCTIGVGFVSCQSSSNSYISFLMNSFDCPYPDSMYMDDDTGSIYAVCGTGIMEVNGGTITAIYNTTRCSSGTVALHGAIIKSPSTGELFASCETQGIFSVDRTGQVRNVSGTSDCSFASSLVISQGFLFASCENTGVFRFNTTDLTAELFFPPPQCQLPVDLITFRHNDQEFLLAACSTSGIFQINLADNSVVALTDQHECDAVTQLARNSSSGIVFAACMQQGAIQINGTEVTSIDIGGDSCPYLTRVWLDERMGVRYFGCANAAVGTILAKFGDSIVQITSTSQCANPDTVFAVEGGLVVLCQYDSILRISSSTLSAASAYAGVFTLSQILVDSVAGNFIARADDQLISVKDGVVTMLADFTVCASGSGLMFRNDDIVASCETSLLFINRFTHNETRLSNSQLECQYLNGFFADPSSDILLFGCDMAGVFAFNLTSMNRTKLFPAEGYGRSFSFQKDVATSTVYISCQSFGVMKYDIATGLVSTAANTTSSCIFTGTIAVNSHGVVYANCYDSSFNSKIMVINGSSIAPLSITPPCGQLAIIGSSSASNTLIAFCSDSSLSNQAGMFTVAIDMLTMATTFIAAYDQCSRATTAYQDPLTGSIWIACLESTAMVSSSQFQCQPGAAWSSGLCVPCALQSYRPFSSVAPLSQCIPCDSGFVTSITGSTSCEPCPPGTFESNNNCVPCPAGQYQPSNASSACISCDAGSYSFQKGSIVCSLCDAGSFSANNGSSTCAPCDRGSASSAMGFNRPCDGCQAGTYQATVGQTSCLTCPSGFYSEQANATSCTRCANKVNANHTTCTIVICDSNSQFNEFTQSCEFCPLSQFSGQGGKCSTCLISTYTPGPGSGCAPCDASGLICSGGLASVERDYWAFPSPTRNWTVSTTDGSGGDSMILTWPLYDTVPCPFCPGSALQVLQANSSSDNAGITYCAYPRLNSADNTLCAQCEPDYLAWGIACVKCNGVNVGLIFGYLVLSFSAVAFLLYSATSTSSAGALSIFLFFIQTATLELGSVTSYIDWIEVTNMSLRSTAACIAPWTAHQQTLFTLLIPLILLAQLLFMAVIHSGLRAILLQYDNDNHNHEEQKSSAASYQLEESIPPLPLSASLLAAAGDDDDRYHLQSTSAADLSRTQRISQFIKLRLLQFSWSKYRAGAMAILLFCYSQVAVACLRYLHCVDVGNERLNFSAPTINCRSSEYRQYLVPVLVALIVYVIGFPCVAFLLLWRKRKDLFAERSESSMDANRSGSDQVSPVIDTWFPYYRMYHRDSWYWQSWVLLRRGCVVVLSVLLTQQPSQRFMLFAFLHLVSLLSHAYVKPYKTERLNQIETASYVLLIFISQLLTSFLPPSYPTYLQVLLFILIVPPAIAMFAFVVWQRYQQWKSSKSKQRRVTPHRIDEFKGDELAENQAEAQRVNAPSGTSV